MLNISSTLKIEAACSSETSVNYEIVFFALTAVENPIFIT
jgi:hypothetical protein